MFLRSRGPSRLALCSRGRKGDGSLLSIAPHALMVQRPKPIFIIPAGINWVCAQRLTSDRTSAGPWLLPIALALHGAARARRGGVQPRAVRARLPGAKF